MHSTELHHRLEREFRVTMREAGLPEPEEVAHLRRALVFVWYATKACVLVDLDELPGDEPPLAGLDLDDLGADVDAGLAASWPGAAANELAPLFRRTA